MPWTGCSRVLLTQCNRHCEEGISEAKRLTLINEANWTNGSQHRFLICGQSGIDQPMALARD